MNLGKEVRFLFGGGGGGVIVVSKVLTLPPIFVKKRTSVNFISERKCCGIDQMFLKDVTKCQLVLRVSCPNWERLIRT